MRFKSRRISGVELWLSFQILFRFTQYVYVDTANIPREIVSLLKTRPAVLDIATPYNA